MQQKDFLETFMVFSPFHFGLERTKIMVGIHVPPKFGTGVGRKILNPLISPSCGPGELKFFRPLEIYGTHTQYECHDPNPNNGAWTIVVIKNFTFFDEGIFQINSQTKVKNVHKSHFVER